MTITYAGQMKDTKQNTRCAIISFNEENKNDSMLAERTIDLMEKVTDWECTGRFSDNYLVSVEDRKDFEEFKQWYKKTKRMFKDCMRYDFKWSSVMLRKVIVNGADKNNKQMRRIIKVIHCDEKEILEKAFEVGFYYVRSYRYNNITTKIF